MRRLRVVLREEAIRDLEDIYDFIVDRGGGPTIALNYIRRIRRRCVRIGDAPRSGVSCDDLRQGLRLMAFERRAVIAYLIDADTVRITNVFYGGRDIEAIYRGRDPTADEHDDQSGA